MPPKPLTGLGPGRADPVVPRCACGCGRDGDRGFPGDIHYATRCVPPTMRFPWEAGYAPPAVEVPIAAAPPPPPGGTVAASQPELF